MHNKIWKKSKKKIISIGMSIIVLSGLTASIKNVFTTSYKGEEETHYDLIIDALSNTNNSEKTVSADNDIVIDALSTSYDFNEEDITVNTSSGINLTEEEIYELKQKYSHYCSINYNVEINVLPIISNDKNNSITLNISTESIEYIYDIKKNVKDEFINDESENIDIIDSNLVNVQDLENITSKTYSESSFETYDVAEVYEYSIETDLDIDKIVNSIVINSLNSSEHASFDFFEKNITNFSYSAESNMEITSYFAIEENIENLKEVIEILIENNLITNDKDLTQLYNLSICSMSVDNNGVQAAYYSIINAICVYNHTLSENHLLLHEILHSLIIENSSNKSNAISSQEEAIVENITLNNVDDNYTRVYYEYREQQSLIELLVVTNNKSMEEYYYAYVNEDYRSIYDLMGSTSTYNDEIIHYSIDNLFNEETSNIKSIYNLSVLNYKNLINNIDNFTYQEHLMFSLIINYSFNTLYELENTDEEDYQLYYDEFYLMEKHYLEELSKYYNTSLDNINNDIKYISTTQKKEFLYKYPDLINIEKLVAGSFYPYYLSLE